jgi:glutamine amidotransferase/cyclase
VQVESAADIAGAQRLIFPGVGAFGQAMDILRSKDYTAALKDYIQVSSIPATL